MERKIVTYGGYFERFMQGLTEKEQQKKTQKTPESEIELAIKIMEGYYADKRSSDKGL